MANEAILAKMKAAATRAGIKDSDTVALADLSGVYVDEATGRLVGADAALSELRKGKPHLFKDARDMSDAEFTVEARKHGVRLP